MSVFPQVSGVRLVQALQKAGFVVRRQHGSHAILRHATDFSRRAIVPIHGSKPVKPGTLRAILKGAGLTAEELKQLM